MELSYAAYNYPNGEELPIIPGAFMGDFTQTAGMLLEDNGFVNISEYNYTSDSRAAHTIGWRPVEVGVSETSQIINDVGGMDNVYQYNIDDKGSVLYNLLDQLRVDRSAHLFDERRDTGADRYDSITNSKSFAAGNKILKPLLVVDIRGSVTWWDWVNDIGAQALPFNNRFAALAEEVFTNVENFYSVSENGSFGRNSSSDYNHKLATWAMELSYAAYNYPNGEELPIIPGAFMGDFTQTAGMLLEDNGFVNISEYNYTSDSRAAHTIGWRPVEVGVSETSQIINDVGGMDNVYQYNIDDKGSVLYNLLDSVCVCDYDQGRNYFRDNTLITGEDTEISTSHDDEIETKPLVVVDVRGSVTLSDWINDVMTQFDSENNRFADEIFTNVENFYSVSENGSFGRNSSSDYNHKLATWAMELSYAAYNYPNGEELPIIPGAFMGDFTQTAGMLLEDNGFVNISEYNYTSDSRAAHTIGWRPVEVGVSETSQIINDVGGMDNVYQYNIDDKGSVLYNLLDSVRVYERNTCRSNSGNPEIMDRNVDVLEVSENSLATTTIKNLVVIDIRGSVTLLDWGNDIVTQFAPNNNRFAALADEVLTNVENYLSSTGLQDPIILVTGHSMGAAIANILAARLNETMDSGNIYAYTFATPRTVNEAVSGNQAVNYPNIFNILNSNDAVTYVPLTITLPVVNYWKRHGIDLYINMPYSESRETDILGMLCQSMSVYLNWLNSSEDLSLQEMLALSEEARVRGLLPIIAKIKCPVGVTIKDSNGNIIGYESQQENAVYPDMLDNGVVSWIEEDGAKMFFIPSIADAASIEIEAYDYGSMNFTVGSVDASTESEIKTLNNISLYPGKEFTADISEDVPVEDTQLFITENGETVGEVTETNPHLKGTRVWHEVCNNGGKDSVVTYWSFTSDKTVTEIHARNKYGGYAYLNPDDSWVKIVEDGDSLIWTVGMYYKDAVDHVYNVSVNSNGEWHTYENALHVHVPQEYADINKEYFSSNATPTNTATIPAAVPYYTVIDPTDN